MFEALVAEGEKAQERTRVAADERLAEVRANVGGTWDKLEKVFEDRVARALHALNVPSRHDIDALSKRGHELTVITKKLSEGRDARPRAAPGRRVVFGCAAAMRHVIGPDGASLTFASQTDLAQHWLVVLRLTLDRDWSWDGLAPNGFVVRRDGVEVGSFAPPRSVNSDALAAPERAQTDLVFIDAIEPKPPIARAVVVEKPGNELVGVLEGKIHALAAGWRDDAASPARNSGPRCIGSVTWL